MNRYAQNKQVSGGRRRTGRGLAVASCAVLLLATSCSGRGGNKVGVIGDSITSMSEEPLRKGLASTYDLQISAQFGARSDEMLQRVKTVASSNPAQAIINLGTNDALQQRPVDQTRASLDEMVTYFSSADCVFLVEINEAITDNGTPRAVEARAINDQIRDIDHDVDNVHVIGWNKELAENGGSGDLTFDTVHLTAKGVALLVETYQRALTSC